MFVIKHDPKLAFCSGLNCDKMAVVLAQFTDFQGANIFKGANSSFPIII